MGFVTGLLVGALGGVVTMALFQGASRNEHDIYMYMEGFNDGQKAPRYTKAEFPIKEEKE